MAENVTFEFLARQLDRVITDQAAMPDDIRMLTMVVLRHETALARLDEPEPTRDGHAASPLQ
jgi:hypothetical protein